MHHFTVDVEEYFQVSALEGLVARSSWDELPGRAAGSVDELLDLMAEGDAQGTFFILGWVAQRNPELVRRIHAVGHEIASHGWDHKRVTAQTEFEFRESVRRTKEFLEDLVGASVIGFRAPSFSIVPGREWALDVLLEEGYRYDSSLFPIRRPGYGYPDGQRDPHWLQRRAGRLAEIPPATVRRLGVTMPAAGGAYFRILPYRLSRVALLDFERRGVPGTFYIHPWEIDAAQPRFAVSFLTRLRHYHGLERTTERLRRLLREFRFQSIKKSLETL